MANYRANRCLTSAAVLHHGTHVASEFNNSALNFRLEHTPADV